MASDGTFILVDIGRYTQFLTGVGIEHGKEITSHLLNSLLKCNRGRWKVANIEGDCLFLYRAGREPTGELLSHVTALYEDFRGRITDVAARSTCQCGACSRTNDLTLKFIVHAGEFDTQKIGNREELIGPEVVVAHRLLKNSVAVTEYVLMSKAYAGDDTPDGLPSTTIGKDDYPDIGTVDYVCLDLQPARREFEKKRQFFVTAEEARIAVTEEIEAPANVVWEAMVDTDKRRQWLSVKEIERTQGESGKIGEIHRCVHDDGSKMIHLTIGIDEVNHRKTEKVWLNRLVKDLYLTMEARELANGRTEAGFYATMQPAAPLISHVFIPIMIRMMSGSVRKDMGRLKAFCEDEVGRSADRLVTDEA